jgi:hypothetical protein
MLNFPTFSFSATLLSVFFLLLTRFTVSAFLSYRRLHHIPGPFLASFSYLWILRTTLSGRTDEIYRSVSEKYGPLVRIGPDYLLTSDPSVLRDIAGARSQYARHGWYAGTRLHPWKNNLASLLDTAEHDRMKAKVGPAYRGRENGGDAEAGVDEQVCRLVARIRDKYLSRDAEPQIVDFSMLSRQFTLDVITRLGYGKEFGFMDCDGDLYGYIRSIDQSFKMLAACVDVPWVRKLLFSPLGLWLVGPKYTDEKGVGKIMG